MGATREGRRGHDPTFWNGDTIGSVPLTFEALCSLNLCQLTFLGDTNFIFYDSSIDVFDRYIGEQYS